MNRRHLYTAVFAIVGVFALAIGGFGQGKGHGGGNPHGGGGGGNPHGGGGGGNPHGGGQPEQPRQQPTAGERQHGGGNPQHQVFEQQRAIQQQQRAVQQQQWQQQRAIQQQQRVAQQQQWQQQRAVQQQQLQQQRIAQQQLKQQQKVNDWNARRQEQANQQAWRQQQEALKQQFRQQYIPPQPQQLEHGWTGHDNGLHRGWTENGPRGNAYGLRGMAPGQTRDLNNWQNATTWPSQQWQQYQQQRAARNQNYNYGSSAGYYNNPYNYDPLATWAPQIYQSYTPDPYGYNNYGYNNGYGYSNYPYNYPSYYSNVNPRDQIIRSIISSFFAPQQDPYATFYAPAYYSNPYYAYNGYNGYNGYATPGYYYSNAGYGTSYYDPYYANDPYYSDYYNGGVPMFASPFYGSNGLKSTLLNLGLQMLQGFLGQGYNQGLSDARYVRVVQGPVYYDPYRAPEPAYYSPYVSSFADQRQIFEQGYQLGYEDAMRNQDPYGTLYGNNARVDIVSQFLANSLLGS